MRRWARTIRLTVDAGTAAAELEGHREQLERMSAAGVLRHAWILGEEDGFLEILETADRHEAEAWCRESPLLEAGFAAWSLVPARPWEGGDS